MGITDADIEWSEASIDWLGSVYPAGQTVAFDQGRGNLIDALEFLRIKAGARIEFYLRAVDAAKRIHAHDACTIVRHALAGWIDFAKLGLLDLPVEAQYRQAAATDPHGAGRASVAGQEGRPCGTGDAGGCGARGNAALDD